MQPSDESSLNDQFQLLWKQAGDGLPDIVAFLAAHAEAPLEEIADIVLIDQHFRWHRGIEPREVEFYLDCCPRIAADPQLKWELVAEEFGYCRQFGVTLVPADFVRRFPDIDPQMLETDGSALTETHSVLKGSASDTHVRRKAADGSNDLPSSFGDYEIIEPLGRGGMGVVYRARQRSANRIVALKLIRTDRLPDSAPEQTEAFARFRREAQLTAQLDTEYVVTVYEVGQVAGRPYYSMKYVEGTSLHDLLRDGPLENRRAARYLESVARGVQAAHQLGILHRDLKPHNVLVESKSDRAMVADFGLAKLIEGDSALSLSGDVFGTPSYMSPEQALDSSKVTALSDVYSLGATLYHALTGRPPFQASTAMETLDQVAHREPAPPRQLNAAVDLDLETICLKAIAKEPFRRYTAVVDFANDLQRYLARKPITARPVGRVERAWRWCRRNPLVAGLTTGVAAALLGGAGVSIYFAVEADARAREADSNFVEANCQRERAETGFREARKTVDQYYTTVSESKLMVVPGLQPLRKELLEFALAYYEKFIDEYGDDPSAQAEMGAAYERVSSITSAIGEKEQALESIEKAIEIQEKLVRENPSVSEYQQNLASFLNSLGILLQDATGRKAGAEASYKKALDIQEKLARENPGVGEYQQEIGRSFHNLGFLQKNSGRKAEAEASYKKALEIYEKLARENPSASTMYYLANSFHNLGVLQGNTGRKAEAEASYKKAIEIYEKLARESSGASEYQRYLANSFQDLANLHDTTERKAEAETSYKRAFEIYEKLARENPSVDQYQQDLAKIFHNLGVLQGNMGRKAEAEASYKQSIEIHEKLARENPTVSSYQYYLAQSVNSLGDLQNATGRKVDAETSHKRALDIQEKLARENPSVSQYQQDLAKFFHNLGVLQGNGGRKTEAEDSFLKSLEIYEKLTREYPRVSEFQSALAAMHNDLGVVQYDTKRLADAEISYKRAIEIHETLVREQPTISQYQVFLANHYGNLGVVQLGTDQKAEAKDSFVHAIDIYEKLVRENPTVSAYQISLARDYNFVAYLYGQADDVLNAEQLYLRAIKTWEQVTRDAPTPGSYQFLFNEHAALASVLRAQGRKAHADATDQRVIEILEKLVRDDPTVAGYEDRLFKKRIDLAAIQGAEGRNSDAEATYRRAIEFRDTLARDHPTVASYQTKLADAYLVVGDAQVKANRAADAEASYVRATEILELLVRDHPADQGQKSELVRALIAHGDLLGMKKRWRDSAALYARAVELMERPFMVRFHLALLQLAAGDEVGYRASCADLMRLHEKDDNIQRLSIVAMACTVGERALDDMEKIVALARKTTVAEPSNPRHGVTLGGAQYRTGHTAEAIETLKKAMPLHSLAADTAPTLLDQLQMSRLSGETFLAMAYHQQGDQAALAKQLQVVRALIDQLEKSPPKPSAGMSPWGLSFTIEMANRELARIEETAK